MTESIGLVEAILLRLIFYSPENVKGEVLNLRYNLSGNSLFNVVKKNKAHRNKAERECDYSARMIIDGNIVMCYFKLPPQKTS